jgi:hypothetical protein
MVMNFPAKTRSNAVGKSFPGKSRSLGTHAMQNLTKSPGQPKSSDGGRPLANKRGLPHGR